MRTDWQGSYLDGRTAARQAATVRLMREGLEITTAAGGTRLWPYRELRQTQGAYAGEEVRLERGGELPETLLVSDTAFLQSLHEAAPHVGARFHDPRRRAARRRWTIVAAGGVVAATVAIYLWGIPLLAGLVTPYVPVAWEEALGRSAMTYLAPPPQRCGDPALGAAMDAVVARLLSAGPPSPYTMRVYVVNRPVVNALAAPGGHVVIFHGLLERTGTPEELAGVMAHELQHVLRRHTTRAVIQDVGTGLLLMALTGDVTGPLAYGLQTARALGELRYSRRNEEDADVEGMRMLLAARVDPAGLITFFEKMEKEEGAQPKALTYLSSHPMPAERIARLKALAATATGPFEPVLPREAWPALTKRC
jgi:beta-barrel assembly-enhancing protease